jgi:hypothetical protein
MGSAPGPIASRTYVKIDSLAAAFESNLPVIILDNYNQGSVPTSTPLQEHYSALKTKRRHIGDETRRLLIDHYRRRAESIRAAREARGAA